VTPLASVTLTNVEAMDDEHEACVTALNELALHRNGACLRRVREVVEQHFKHEEDMLDQYFYHHSPRQSTAETNAGGKRKYRDGDDGEKEEEGKEESSSTFSVAASARQSHYADHQRMLRHLQTLQDKLDEEKKGNAEGGEGSVDAKGIQTIMQLFEQHAERYDGDYAGKIKIPGSSSSSSLSKAM